jgi:haloalkane dehalogenase
MGKSDKPDIEYSIFDHIKYVEKFIQILNLQKITLIMHGWGSLIGFDYAMRNEKNCKGLVFYESYLRPANGEDASLPMQEQLHDIDQQENILDIVTNGASFIDKFIPQEMLNPISDDELTEYRKPFMEKGSERPLFQYIKELPRIDRDDKVNQLIANYSEKLVSSKLPKLMLYSVPGFVTTIATAMWAKNHLLNLEIADVGEELHYAQESHPELMGETISAWLQGIEATV